MAGGSASSAPGRNIVPYCPLAGRPGHSSSVVETGSRRYPERYRDDGRNTWHYKKEDVDRVRHYTFTV